MTRGWTRVGLLLLGVTATAQAALAQQFGPAERQEVLAQVAALGPADRAEILTTTMPGLVATLNAQMPMRVDEITTAIAVTYEPTVIEYSYRIDPGVNFGPDLMDDQRTILERTMCNQHDTFFILALGVTLRYVYEAGKAELGTLDLVLADCDAAPALK